IPPSPQQHTGDEFAPFMGFLKGAGHGHRRGRWLTRPARPQEYGMRGGCYCGYVVYEVSPPFSEETNCHCSICRRTSGAPFVAWLTAEAAMFRLVEGKPTQFRSSSHATRTFCPRCGTQLTFASDRTPEQVDVTIASLSDADS